MAKQIQLKNLLQDLERATRTHQNLLNLPVDINARNDAFNAADIAEKRVFSLFDGMQRELESLNRIATERLNALSAAVSERDALKHKLDSYVLAPAAPVDPLKVATVTVPVEPFNDMRARAGDPIEVLMAPDQWIEKPYIGTYKSPHSVQAFVVYVHDDKPVYAPLGSVRMKPTTQTVQMFANVFKDEQGKRAGALYDNADMACKFVGTVPPPVQCIGTAIPVTVTVAA